MATSTSFQDSSNVTFAKPFSSASRSGYIWLAPLGTAVPDSATAELDPEFQGLGYISEDGLVEPSSLDMPDAIIAAGGDVVAQGDPTLTKTWTGEAIEVLRPALIAAEYGSDNVETVDNGEIHVKEQARTPEHWTIVIKELLRDNRVMTSILRDATFVISDDITHSHEDVMTVPFTITGFPTSGHPVQERFISAAPASTANTTTTTSSDSE